MKLVYLLLNSVQNYQTLNFVFSVSGNTKVRLNNSSYHTQLHSIIVVLDPSASSRFLLKAEERWKRRYHFIWSSLHQFSLSLLIQLCFSDRKQTGMAQPSKSMKQLVWLASHVQMRFLFLLSYL